VCPPIDWLLGGCVRFPEAIACMASRHLLKILPLYSKYHASHHGVAYNFRLYFAL
jgi:hypothetical protein